jgi:lipopolysaccharide export system permease protein
MTQITRYILKQLLVGLLMVTAGLVAVIWITQSLRFVELIVSKGLSIGSFLFLTLLLLPNFLVIILPISLFAVLLFTYNKLIMDRELIVMRAAGMSQLGLARPALLLGFVATVLGYVMNIHVIPRSVQSFREMQWTVRNDYSQVLLQEGMFNTLIKGLTVYVRSRNNEGELLGIFVHDARKPEKPVTMMAERGALIRSETGPRVLMVNGNRQEISTDTGRLSLLYFDSYTVEVGTNSGESAELRYRDARERSLKELLTATEKEVGATDVRRFRVEFHQRMAMPWMHLSLAMIGLACLLSGGFSRHGQTIQVGLAIFLVVLVEAASLGISNKAIGSLSWVPLIYINALLPAAVGGLILVFPRLLAPRRSQMAVS